MSEGLFHADSWYLHPSVRDWPSLTCCLQRSALSSANTAQFLLIIRLWWALEGKSCKCLIVYWHVHSLENRVQINTVTESNTFCLSSTQTHWIMCRSNLPLYSVEHKRIFWDILRNVWSSMFFKISFAFPMRKKILQVWHDMNVSKEFRFF